MPNEERVEAGRRELLEINKKVLAALEDRLALQRARYDPKRPDADVLRPAIRATEAKLERARQFSGALDRSPVPICVYCWTNPGNIRALVALPAQNDPANSHVDWFKCAACEEEFVFRA